MERDDNCRPVYSHFLTEASGSGCGQRVEQTVDHHVADEDDLRVWLTLGSKLSVGITRWREKKISEPICHDAVDFLGHRPVEATQASLDMGDANPKLRGNNCRRHCGV